jgi:hypothetical protein
MTVLVVDVFSEVLVPTPADLLVRVFLDHDDRHDGAGGDYVKIFSIQTLSTTLKVSESMQGHSISGLNALILPPPQRCVTRFSKLEQDPMARVSVKMFFSIPDRKNRLQRLIATSSSWRSMSPPHKRCSSVLSRAVDRESKQAVRDASLAKPRVLRCAFVACQFV